MKPYLVVLSLLSIQMCWSQSSDLRDHLLYIIAETPNDFRAFRREVKEVKGKDTVFHSKVSLAGAYEAEINAPGSYVFEGDTVRYNGLLSVCTGYKMSEKEAKNTVKKWRNDIKDALGNDWKEDDYTRNYGPAGTTKGYILEKDGVMITVWYSLPRGSTNHCHSYIQISR